MASSRNRGRTARGLLGSGLIAVVALALLWLAVPRFIASMVMLEAADVRQRFELRQEIRAEDAKFAGPVYERALGWFEDPEWLAEWGYIQLEAGLDLLSQVTANLDDAEVGDVSLEPEQEIDPQLLDNPPQRGAGFAEGADAAVLPTEEEAYRAIEGAINTFEAALARRPSDAETWYQLAYARLLLEPDDPQGWRALVASIRGAPAAPSLVFERIEFAFWQWDAINEAARAELPEQYKRALELEPDTFAEIVEAYERSADVWPIVLPWLEAGQPDDPVTGWPY